MIFIIATIIIIFLFLIKFNSNFCNKSIKCSDYNNKQKCVSNSCYWKNKCIKCPIPIYKNKCVLNKCYSNIPKALCLLNNKCCWNKKCITK